ncbi:G-D-S-L family lipolytic protein [Winogradskyella maritima]|uniref:G-D-S-L family lipolytic protein n=1 Tax=Winogradskyella maritima TaxID=1517766 RepID=A0ABV8AEZ6_9FLAO|nr:G-D-S-L family lipolytic protein [Winogradskyella maritima]
MKKLKYIALSFFAFGFMACENELVEDFRERNGTGIEEPLPALTAGSANFSTYVSMGNSLTAGFTDGALFRAAQENSMPNILNGQFQLVGGGSFTQPLTSDNLGGLAIGGNRIDGFNPRLVFNGSGPAGLETVIGPVTVTTDLLNNPSGPFNNMGVPGAKSFHLLAPGYGNLANLSLGLANPYFVRMTGSTPNASVLELSMAQSPSFVSLWIGNNDVLGYALSGGESNPLSEDYDPITPMDGPPGVGFAQSYGALAQQLTSGGAQGIMANIPDVTSIPHFTTVPHNPLDPSNPSFGPLIPQLNQIYGALNAVFAALGEGDRAVVFSETEASAVVIRDESLDDISDQITFALSNSPTFPAFIGQFGLPPEAAPIVANLLGQTYGRVRQATEADLFVLPSASIIGTVNTDVAAALIGQGLPAAVAGQFAVEGVTLPLADKWALTPTEQAEIATATANFNSVIKASQEAAGWAFLDANTLLNNLSTAGIDTGDFVLTSDLVLGGAFSLDGVHPTARGYALIANEMMKAIDATYGSNFEASGSLVDVGNYPTNYSPLLQ